RRGPARGVTRPAVCVTTLRDRSAVSNWDRRGGLMHRDRWSRPVIAAATEVHRILGPGLPETVYKVALAEELRRRSIPFERDKTVPIRYRDLVLITGPHHDLIVGIALIADAISVCRLSHAH